MAWLKDGDENGDWEAELERTRLIEAQVSNGCEWNSAMPTSSTMLNGASGALASAAGSMTYSASCPSLTSLYDDVSSDSWLLNDASSLQPQPLVMAQPSSSQMALFQPTNENGFMTHASTNSTSTAFMPLNSIPYTSAYDTSMGFQHPPLATANQQHFGYQLPTNGHPLMRRPIQSSLSFTNLSSMEVEMRRRQGKRKKGLEAFCKRTRHKSFDEIGPPAVGKSGDGAESTRNSTVQSSLNDVHTSSTTSDEFWIAEDENSDMVGFSIDELPMAPPSSSCSSSWGASASSLAMPSSSSLGTTSTSTSTTSTTTSSSSTSSSSSIHTSTTSPTEDEEAFLLGEDVNVNVTSLLDSIDPSVMEEIAHKQRKAEAAEALKQEQIDPENHPSIAVNLLFRDALELRFNRRALLKQQENNAPAALIRDKLFTKSQETAGSLWLLVHAFKCVTNTLTECELSGCLVMQKVVKHCLACPLAVGECRDVCNEAKLMAFHYGVSRCQSLRRGCGCQVCLHLQEIDQTHQALSTGYTTRTSTSTSTSIKTKPNPNGTTKPPTSVGQSPSRAASLKSGPALIPTPAPAVPLALAPKMLHQHPSSLPKHHSSTSNKAIASSSAASKHVPIQPNPLSGYPRLLMGGFPQVGALALYLEQTSTVFRAEVQVRVESRVKTEAGQDLLQHMHKKTRLRSLDEIRKDARICVLREMEQDIQLHLTTCGLPILPPNAHTMFAAPGLIMPLNGFSACGTTTRPPPSPPPPSPPTCSLPPHVLNVATAEITAFFTQQTTAIQAVTKRQTESSSGSSVVRNGMMPRSVPPTVHHQSSTPATTKASSSASSVQRTPVNGEQSPNEVLMV